MENSFIKTVKLGPMQMEWVRGKVLSELTATIEKLVDLKKNDPKNPIIEAAEIRLDMLKDLYVQIKGLA